MHIGILGSGLMGGKLGTIFARGHARAGTSREAALNADALLLAVHWSRVNDVLTQVGDTEVQPMRRRVAWIPSPAISSS